MVEEINNLILEHLRAIRGDIAELRRDNAEIKERLNRVELGLAALRREVAILGEGLAQTQVYVDRLTDRVAHIERRLDIGEALPPLA